MRRLVALAIAIVALSACSTAPNAAPESVAYWHDDAHGVSCWLYGGGRGSYTAAISCLPDSAVLR